MLCSNCGKEIEEGSAFCPSCGKTTGGTSQNAAPNPAPQQVVYVKQHKGFVIAGAPDEVKKDRRLGNVRFKYGLICKKCGTKNNQKDLYCKDCGKYI